MMQESYKAKSNKKIKILYYEPSSGFGGSARCLRDWLEKLDTSRFQPFIAFLDTGPAIKSIKKICKDRGFEFIDLLASKNKLVEPVFSPAQVAGYWNFFLYLLRRVMPVSVRLAVYIKKKQIDLIHINTPIVTGLEGILASKMNGIPSICHLHETRKWSRIERGMGRFISKFICLTDEAKNLYQNYVPLEKIVRIYNGISKKENLSTDSIKSELNISGSESVVGIVGRITMGKGHDIYLQAAKRILEKCPHTTFLIVGATLNDEEEKYSKRLIALVETLGISHKVIFTGWREDAMNIIANMNVMVQASDTFPEGFPLTCIEAMSLGVPLVATNIPGPSEIVVDGQTGFLVPPGYPEPLADAVIKIIEDASLAKKFGEAARMRVRDYFDLNKIVNQIESVYNDLISHADN